MNSVVDEMPQGPQGMSPDNPPQETALTASQGRSDEKKPGRDGRREPLPLGPARPSIGFDDVVSGRFDAEEAEPDSPMSKRVLAPQVETPKLHKVLAQSGMGSRLEMEQLILEGRITVNNEPAHIGQRIQFGDQVKVNGKAIRVRIQPPPPRVIAYHKPAGEVVTHDDPQNRPTVFRRLPKLAQGKWQSVGRLDLNTEGLLLFTNSGELANNLMHPRFGLEREYAVRVLGALSQEEKSRLIEGVPLDDGLAQFGSVDEGGGEGSNCWYRVTISEGRYREVRRMFEAVGHAVSRLIRIRYGAMLLPRGLKRGGWVELDDRDIRSLTHLSRASHPRGSGATGDPQGRRASKEGAPGDRDGLGSRSGRPTRGPNVRLTGRKGRAGGPPGMNPSTGAAGSVYPGRKPMVQRGDRGGAAGQPDPMKTSLGYIGADSFTRQRDQSSNLRGPTAGGGNGRRSGRRRQGP